MQRRLALQQGAFFHLGPVRFFVSAAQTRRSAFPSVASIAAEEADIQKRSIRWRSKKDIGRPTIRPHSLPFEQTGRTEAPTTSVGSSGQAMRTATVT